MGFYCLVDKDRCHRREARSVFGSAVLACATFSATFFHIGMSLEIILEATSHNCPLLNDIHIRRSIFLYFVIKERVVGAPQDDGVNLWIFAHNLVDALLYKVVGSRRVGLVVFY